MARYSSARARRRVVVAVSAWLMVVRVALSAGQAAWEPTNGPYGGHVHDLVVTPDGTVFAGVEVEGSSHFDPDNGAYRSDDGGRSWRRVPIPQIDRPIEGLTYAGGTLYARDRGRAVSSTDGGLSWTRVSPQGGWVIAANDRALFRAWTEYDREFWEGVGVLLRSTDGGETWAKVFRMTTTGRVACAAFHGDDLYVGTSAGLFRSSDLGDTWTAALTEGHVTAIVSTPRGVTVAEWETGVLSAEDPAARWDETNLDPRYQHVTGFAPYRGELYVATRGRDMDLSGAGVLRLGAEDSDLGSPGLTDFVITSIVSTDEGLVVGTYSDGVFGSADGETWEPCNEGMPRYRAPVEAVDGALYTNGFRSVDGGATWVKPDLRLPFSDVRDSIVRHGPDAYVARRRVGGVWASDDGGTTWRQVVPDGEALNIRRVSRSRDHVALLTAEGLFISDDGGRTLPRADSPLEPSDSLLLAYTGEGLYLGDLDGRLRRSVDNGASWETLPRAPRVEGAYPSQRVQFLAEIGDTMLATTSDGFFTRAVGGGRWEPVDIETPRVYGASAVDGVVSVRSGGSVLRSADVGRTWRRVAPSPPISTYGALAVLHGWMYAGTTRGVYRLPLADEAPPLPELGILAPTPHTILPDGMTTVEVQVDRGDYAGPWQWRVDEPFPTNGPAGGVPAQGSTAVVDGLSPGRMHTIHVAPTTADGTIVHRRAARSVSVYAPVPNWLPPGDLAGTLIAATVNRNRIVLAEPNGARRLNVPSPVGGRAFDRPTPRWSLRRRLLTVQGEGSAKGEFVTVDIDTGDVTPASLSTLATHASHWSPDGIHFAFVSSAPEPTDRDEAALYIGAAGAPGGRLVMRAPSIGDPVWSPDGSRLAFTHYRGGTWVVDVEGHNPVQVSRANQPYDWILWSPDSARIAGRLGGGMWMANADGTQYAAFPAVRGHIFEASWSPDALQLAISAEGPEGQGVYVVGADGSDPRLLIPNGRKPAWSPFDPGVQAPSLSFAAPAPDRTTVLDSRETSIRVRMTIRNHDHRWTWRLDEPFPVAGAAGGHLVEGIREATVTGLQAGVTHTIYATLVDDAGAVVSPPVVASARVRVRARDAGRLDDTRIAYLSGDSRNPQSHTIRGDGLDLRLVSTRRPSPGVWSPDGSRLAFVEYAPKGYQLVVADPEGGSQRVVYTHADVRDPSWSPDGVALLVASQDVDVSLVSVEVASGAATTIAAAAEPIHRAVWSPDHTTIAAIVERGLVLIDPASGEMQEASAALGPATSLSWSPDGAEIAVAATDPRLWDLLVTAQPGVVIGPPWPDWYETDPGADPAIYVVDVADGGTERIGAGSRPKWSPDGRWVAYLDTEAGVTLQALEGAARAIVPPNYGHTYGDVAWAPDSSSLVFADAHGGRSSHLYAVDLTTGERRMVSDGVLDAWAPAWSAVAPPPASLVTVHSPAAGQILQASARSVPLVVEGESRWAWRLNELFPTVGAAGGSQGAPGATTIDGLESGATYTLRVAVTDDDGRLHVPADITTVRFSVTIHADTNVDGVVDVRDLVHVGSLFGQAAPFEVGDPDVDGDGSITIADLLLVAADFGERLDWLPRAAPAMPGAEDAPALRRWSRDAERVAATRQEYRDGLATLRALLRSVAPRATALLPNYPNPFNPETWIPFDLSEDADVSLLIYDTRGRRVRLIDLGRLAAGAFRGRADAAHWDGRSDAGEPVASGVYVVELRAGPYRETRRVAVRK